MKVELNHHGRSSVPQLVQLYRIQACSNNKLKMGVPLRNPILAPEKMEAQTGLLFSVH
jgi:hypothetical protein